MDHTHATVDAKNQSHKMRTALKPLDNLRREFTGTFERFGRKTSYKGYPTVTVLLTDIKDSSGKTVTDHLWFSYTKGFLALGDLREGDLIEFHARVREYVKGYRGYRDDAAMENPPRIDYRLSHPTQFRIIKQGKGEPVEVPDFKPKPDPCLGCTDPVCRTRLDNNKSADQQTDLTRLI